MTMRKKRKKQDRWLTYLLVTPIAMAMAVVVVGLVLANYDRITIWIAERMP